MPFTIPACPTCGGWKHLVCEQRVVAKGTPMRVKYADGRKETVPLPDDMPYTSVEYDLSRAYGAWMAGDPAAEHTTFDGLADLIVNPRDQCPPK